MLAAGTKLSGVNFNRLYSDTKFYKFLNDDLIHNNFVYDLGLNTDTETFNPDGECLAGGLYFCEEIQCHLFWNTCGSKLGSVSIPDDAQVYVEKYSFKVDKIIINDVIDFVDVPDKFWIDNIFDRYESVVEYAKYHLEKAVNAYIEKADTLQYSNSIKIHIDKECALIAKQNCLVLEFIKEPTHEMCMKAVGQNGLVLKYIKHPTTEMYEIAVKENGLALAYVGVENQTSNLCGLAVKQNMLASQFVSYSEMNRPKKNNGSVRKLYRSLTFRLTPSFEP